MHRALAMAAIAGLGASPAAQFQVWTVDDDGPADFSSIQDAIDAAQDGDALLIRGGSYLPAVVDAKRLTLLANDGEIILMPHMPFTSSTPELTVRNTSSAQPVTLVGLNLATQDGGSSTVGLDAVDVQGALWIQDSFLYSVAGATATNAYLVARDTVVLGDFNALPLGLGSGGDGLFARNSTLRLYGCTLQGSVGKNAGCIIGFSCGTSGVGGSGLTLASASSAHLSGVVCQGGDGQHSFCDSVSWGDAGSGGDGLHAGPGSQTLAIDTEFLPGAAGLNFGVACADGVTGVAQSGPGAVTISPHVRRSLDVTDIAREGETVAVTITAPANESVFVGIATTPGELQDPLIDGPLILGSAPGVLPLGPMPATGSMTLSFPAPDLPPGVDFFTLYLQPAFAVAPGVGVAGDPMALVILDSAF